jgi:protein involved in polysaccharide export with SLBB domain
MGRTLALVLRLSVIASAIVMLVLSVRAVRAQDMSTAKPQDQVYGYNPGQGMAKDYSGPDDGRFTPPDLAPAIPAQRPTYGEKPYGENPQVTAQQAAPPQPLPIAQKPTPAAFGYVAGHGPAAQSADTRQAAGPDTNDQPTFAAPRINSDYRLGPGDKVRVTVFGETDLSGEYQLDGTGIVRLPLIGSMRAIGATAPALERTITSALSPNYLKNPKVNVEITAYRPFFIVGAVNRPGQYPYVDHMSALNAVALAGGFTDQAKQSSLYVRREGSVSEEEVATDQLSELRPGDTIRVQTTLFWDAMQIFTPLAGPAALAATVIR